MDLIELPAHRRFSPAPVAGASCLVTSASIEYLPACRQSLKRMLRRLAQLELEVTCPMLPSDRIALFIDGANLHATARALGFDVDYRRLLKEFQSRGALLRAFYYTTIIEDPEYTSIRPLIDWLDYNGYTVVTKPTKEFIDAGGRRKVKGNMSVELAVNAMELAGHIDRCFCSRAMATFARC